MSKIVYNGFTLDHAVRITSFDSKPLFAEDGRSQVTTEHTIQGTAFIGKGDAASFEANYKDARTRLVRSFNPGEDFLIQVGSATLFDSTDVSGSTRDQFDGPQAEFKLTKIIGEISALATFTIRWWNYEKLASETTSIKDVIAHTWTQEWDIDSEGLAVHRVVGTLQVRSDAAATPGTGRRIGTNPDAYREIVVPELPNGFRRERMQFLTDETGNKLIYLIEDKQYASDLPHPASTGNGTYVFRRSRSQNLLGIKVFQCELAGPPNVSAAALLDAAVLVSRNRIDYNADNIVSIEVGEELFGSNRIRLKVVAQAISTKGSLGDDTLELPQNNFTLLQDVMENVPGYQDKPPYGSALLRSVRRALFIQTDTADISPPAPDNNTFPSHVPKARFEQAPEDGVVTTTVAASEQAFDGVMQQLGALNRDAVRQANINAPYLKIEMSDRTIVRDTGVIVQRPQSIDATALDFPIQVRRPKVYVVQTAYLVRQGLAPEVAIRPPVPSSILISAESTPTQGFIDNSGQHIFAVYHRRVYQVIFGSASRNNPYFVGSDNRFMEAWPPLSAVNLPPDPRISNNSPTSNPWLTTPGEAGPLSVNVGSPPRYLA